MTPETLRITTRDDIDLVATHYRAPSDQFIAIGCATAVPRGFYRRFGEYVQRRGVNAVVADYRGIGDSVDMLGRARGKPTLRGFRMDYADWSRYDLAAVVDYCAARGSVYLAGHSLGGHALGQLPNRNVVRAAYFCGTGSGWHGWMPSRAERLRAQVMWNVIGPVTTRVYGYHPMGKFGMGEDIPLGVFRDWKRWCKLPHYFFDDPTAAALTAGFSDVRIPIAAAVSIDDQWAPPRSRDAFFKGYANAAVEPIDLIPRELGVAKIGHIGYFRAQVGAQLWPRIMQWLAQHGLKTTNPPETQHALPRSHDSGGARPH